MVRSFTVRFWSHDPRGVSEAVFLALALAGLQGIGILLLVPLIAYIGVPDGDGGGAVTAVASVFFDGLGFPRSLPAILALYVALVSARAFLERRRAIHEAQLRFRLVRGIRSELYTALIRAEGRFLSGSRDSEFVQTLTHDVERVGHAALSLLRVGTLSVVLGLHLLIALMLSVSATLLTCLVAVGLSAPLRGKLSAALGAGRALTGRADELYSTVQQHLAGITEIKSYTAEERGARAFANAIEEIDAVRVAYFLDRFQARLWMTIGSATALALTVLIAIEGLDIPLASLLLLTYLFARALPQVTQLQQTVLDLLNQIPALESIEDQIARARARAMPEEEADAPPLTERIAFDRVSFAYQPGVGVLQDVSLTLLAHRTTAVVGPSGAGKSTIAMLLMGFSPPDSGRILVDGAPLDPRSQRRWRERIGYVPQHTFLFHDTIRENLKWARPDATDEQIWGALADAAADDFVRRAPRGLDTVVGDRGARLSGGERQRVALARALLAQPEILLLDEATNAVDVESERRIFEALERLRGRMTIVLITHRLPSADLVDDVVEVDGGRARVR